MPLNLCPQPMLCECEPFDEWCALHGRVVLSCSTVACRAAVGCVCIGLPVWNVTAFFMHYGANWSSHLTYLTYEFKIEGVLEGQGQAREAQAAGIPGSATFP